MKERIKFEYDINLGLLHRCGFDFADERKGTKSICRYRYFRE